MGSAITPVFFRRPADLRRWFGAHATTAAELWVGFYRKSAGKMGVTYQEALDEALAVGWIDGVRKRLDGERYVQRFTPRRRGSKWSLVNIARVQALQAAGRMKAAGLRAFQARDESKAQLYSYERKASVFDPVLERIFRAEKDAWAFFEAQPLGYRRTLTWWVISARQEETRLRRLRALIDHSSRGRRMR